MDLYSRLIFFLVLLAGCSPPTDVERLKAENLHLQNQIAQYQENEKSFFAAKKAELDEAGQQAAVARGCHALINLCPEWLTEPGERAIAAGAGPGNTWLFWSIYLIKFILPLVPITLFFWLWIEWIGPRIEGIKNQKAEIDEALNKLKIEQENTSRGKEQVREDLKDLFQKLASAEDELDQKIELIRRANDELQKLEAAIKAKELFAQAFNIGKKT